MSIALTHCHVDAVKQLIVGVGVAIANQLLVSCTCSTRLIFIEFTLIDSTLLNLILSNFILMIQFFLSQLKISIIKLERYIVPFDSVKSIPLYVSHSNFNIHFNFKLILIFKIIIKFRIH